MKDPQFDRMVAEVSKEFIARGQLIEAGFAGLVAMAYPDAPPDQVETMREVFFAGAQHVWGTMMTVLDPGEEPTEADMTKMELIQAELDRFIIGFKARHGLTGSD